ncbi:unnamed protein product, partial [Gadus morhua 'NCC']
ETPAPAEDGADQTLLTECDFCQRQRAEINRLLEENRTLKLLRDLTAITLEVCVWGILWQMSSGRETFRKNSCAFCRHDSQEPYIWHDSDNNEIFLCPHHKVTVFGLSHKICVCTCV